MDTRDRRRRSSWLALSLAPFALGGAVAMTLGSGWAMAPDRGREGPELATVDGLLIAHRRSD